MHTYKREQLLKIVFSYLLAIDILKGTLLVCKEWKNQSLFGEFWQDWARRRWCRWKGGELQQFHFLFREGDTEDEIKNIEKRIGCHIRHDIRELMKQCSGINFPGNLFHLSFHPAICLLKVSDWRCFNHYCQTVLGQNPRELYHDFDSSTQHLIIGCNVTANYLMFVLLNTTSWRVISFTDDLSDANIYGAQFQNLGTFDDWFDTGSLFCFVSPQQQEVFEKVSNSQRQIFNKLIVSIIKRYRSCLLCMNDWQGSLTRWLAFEEIFIQTYLQSSKMCLRTLQMHCEMLRMNKRRGLF